MVIREISDNNRFGYVRVSSKSQEHNFSIEAQKKKLMSEGRVPVENIFVEIGSAGLNSKERPIFNNLIENTLTKGNLLMVSKLDRCSRDTLDFLRLQDKLLKKGIHFIALDLPHSTDMAVNQLIATTLAAIATFENERRKDRQRVGINLAREAGKYKGRKSVITPELIREVDNLLKKDLSVTQISKITNKSRGTIYKILKQELGFTAKNALTKN